MAALSEFQLIERFFRRPARSAVLGVGDDAALVAPSPGCEVALAVDMLVSGRHFFADVDAQSLGHKTLAVNLSDMAAMGATPRWALLAGALPAADPVWLAAFAKGLFALADAHRVDLIGGDTTQGPLTLCVTIVGEVAAGRALRRSGALPSDAIWVSGTLGDAALALAHRQGRIELAGADFAACEHALLWPTPRVALGERLLGIASAAIDVSDGLTGDLGHVLQASGVGAQVELAALPCSDVMRRQLAGTARETALRCLLAGGDDYELCFTAPTRHTPVLQAMAGELGIPLACIGAIRAQGGLVVRDETGRPLARLPFAFDHFAN